MSIKHTFALLLTSTLIACGGGGGGGSPDTTTPDELVGTWGGVCVNDEWIGMSTYATYTIHNNSTATYNEQEFFGSDCEENPVTTEISQYKVAFREANTASSGCDGTLYETDETLVGVTINGDAVSIAEASAEELYSYNVVCVHSDGKLYIGDQGYSEINGVVQDTSGGTPDTRPIDVDMAQGASKQ